jgi:hypothetical protein
MGPGGGRSRRIERIGLIVRIGRIGPIGRTGRTDGSDGLTDRQMGELQDSNNFPTNIFGSRATAAPRKGAHGTPMGGPLWRMDQNTCVITKINTTKICVLGWRSRPQKGMQMTATTHIVNTCTYIYIYIHTYIHVYKHIHIYIYHVRGLTSKPKACRVSGRTVNQYGLHPGMGRTRMPHPFDSLWFRFELDSFELQYLVTIYLYI